jgi:CheY-like chemotaxis protein
MNLCSNAAQAMGQSGGVLEIGLEKVNFVEGEEVPDPYLIHGPYLRLTISDTGQGMTPEVRERIFDPYFTTKEQGKGSGLGLSVVQGIVKKHRGVITCKSKPGEGTTFDIYFPEIDSREKQVKCLEDVEPHIEISNSTGTERILFIDDDSTLGYLAYELLGGLGYEVVTKTSSIEALNLFKERPDKFDLVITDMTMPVMTGDRLAQKILEIRRDIPIILCTGYSEYISKEKAESIGIREFIMKPFEMKDMAITIRKVLDKE